MTHDKEFYLRLAAVYRLLAKENKHTALEKAYESVAGKPWPYGNSLDMGRDYAAFAAAFVLALSGSKTRLSPKLPTPPLHCPVTVTPTPMSPPKSQKRGAYTLSPLTEDDDNRTYKKGIAVRGEWVYATNDKAMAKIRDDRWQEFGGTSLMPYSLDYVKDGLKPLALETEKVEYDKVIPVREKGQPCVTYDLEKLLAVVYGTWWQMSCFSASVYVIVLRFPLAVLFICYARWLYETLRILRLNGGCTVEICRQAYPKPLALLADNGNVGIIAPMAKLPDTGVVSQPIDLTDYQVLPPDNK